MKDDAPSFGWANPEKLSKTNHLNLSIKQVKEKRITAKSITAPRSEKVLCSLVSDNKTSEGTLRYDGYNRKLGMVLPGGPSVEDIMEKSNTATIANALTVHQFFVGNLIYRCGQRSEWVTNKTAAEWGLF